MKVPEGKANFKFSQKEKNKKKNFEFKVLEQIVN